MPVISRFLGIVIAMYWDDHSPPHFHAKYSGYEINPPAGAVAKPL
ncbi:MAG: DUF4160 domain-containing protein [Verrucomicrobia bacterium]|nr:DUF4160 domain-containing protein [Verrucomicrobiota bacterium]